jgi:hypothetical protein
LFILVPSFSLAQLNKPAGPELRDGYHFVVLIDDSGDVKKGHKDEIARSLPDQLFNGIEAQRSGKQLIESLPKFEPDRDQVSVLFFTIHGKNAAATADPAKMFELEYAGTLKGKSDFAARLNGWLWKAGRSGGNYSPIALSQLLALSYLQKHLPEKNLYSRTFFIVATNGRYNVSSPGHELVFLKGENVRDIEIASEEAFKASSLFYFKIPPGWIISRPGQVYYLVSELRPQAPPESALQFQNETSLDVVAESANKLRVKLKNQQPGDIQIIKTPSNLPYKFEPLRVRAGFEDSKGDLWKIGDTILPRSAQAVDLSNCKQPKCIEKDNVLNVSLFDSAVEGLSLSPNQADPDPGKISFTAGFRYLTDVYDLLYVETPEQTIDVKKIDHLTLPGILFLPDSKIDKSDLASEWSADDDKLTTQEEAKNRILTTRNWVWLVFSFLLFMAGILAVFYLYQTAFHRRFHPKMEWRPVPEVVVDFNRPAASRLLLGTMQIINGGEIPWFGKRLKNKEQPARNATFSLSYNFFEKNGFKVNDRNPIGFIRGTEGESDLKSLSSNIQEVVSHRKQIYLFLAADSIADCVVPGAGRVSQGKDFGVPLSVEMNWQRHETDEAEVPLIERILSKLRGDESGSITEQIECKFTVKPEEERKPTVIFKPSEDEYLDFKKGEAIRVGTFHFMSQAEHTFAKRFVWGDYIVKTYRDNLPLSGEPIRLDPSQVEVLPLRRAEVPVYLYCDGETISNPDPASNVYTFRLIGDFDAKSEPGPYAVTLHRDQTRAEIELTISYPEPMREIFWAKDGSVKQRFLLSDGAGTHEATVADGRVELDQVEILFDKAALPSTLLELKVGNSARSGRGSVLVDVEARFMIGEDAIAGIHMQEDRPLSDMLEVCDSDVIDSTIRVYEGEEPEKREVRIDTGLITKIEGARTEPDQCWAEVFLNIRVDTDQGDEDIRHLMIIIPVVLEKLPGLNWLCIDFGTSAIAAALGTGKPGGIVRIPLQEIKAPGGTSLRDYDINNAEVNSDYLLPSWVICDADLRTKFEVEAMPGFPVYFDKNKPLSLTPGEPDFVGLPALSGQFEIEEKRDRIIYSLKSWLGKSAHYIPLRTEVSYRENGKLVTRDVLPLDRVVQSGLAALAEAYLRINPEYYADQIVLTYPNTFTQRHKDLLHQIAFDAFRNRFDIPLKERIRLISESDAVAYYYCWEQMRTTPRSGTERMLIYDFGAGTLDLSIIHVEWQKEPVCYPRGWKVKGRIGVPVAGNNFDELLARLVDRLLLDKSVTETSGISYVYRVVARSFVQGEKPLHSAAITRLWRWIREAKHSWNGTDPLTIKVGLAGTALGVVTGSKEKLKTAPPTDEFGLPRAGLWVKDENIYLSIPADQVHEDKRISALIEFTTETVIDELFYASNLKPDEIDTIVVSGRGALWPGLRERVWRWFPNAETPNLLKDDAMKDAVVRGAIARQQLLIEESNSELEWQPKLGVLINNDHDLLMEDKWDKPVDLTSSPTFRIVQVNLKSPDPRNDMNSLRRHFYVDLISQEFHRGAILGGAKKIYIKKEMRDDKLAIFLENMQRNKRVSIFTHLHSAEGTSSPPWPVGGPLLEPEG